MRGRELLQDVPKICATCKYNNPRSCKRSIEDEQKCRKKPFALHKLITDCEDPKDITDMSTSEIIEYLILNRDDDLKNVTIQETNNGLLTTIYHIKR